MTGTQVNLLLLLLLLLLAAEALRRDLESTRSAVAAQLDALNSQSNSLTDRRDVAQAEAAAAAADLDRAESAVAAAAAALEDLRRRVGEAQVGLGQCEQEKQIGRNLS